VHRHEQPVLVSFQPHQESPHQRPPGQVERLVRLRVRAPQRLSLSLGAGPVAQVPDGPGELPPGLHHLHGPARLAGSVRMERRPPDLVALDECFQALPKRPGVQFPSGHGHHHAFVINGHIRH
jgi:hypothetical protein